MTLPESAPPDPYSLDELRPYLSKLREQGAEVNALLEAPLDFPGVDDKGNRFAWYEIKVRSEGSAELQRVAVFHLPKGVEL